MLFTKYKLTIEVEIETPPLGIDHDIEESIKKDLKDCGREISEVRLKDLKAVIEKL